VGGAEGFDLGDGLASKDTYHFLMCECILSLHRQTYMLGTPVNDEIEVILLVDRD
jgi:hypothetical protein